MLSTLLFNVVTKSGYTLLYYNIKYNIFISPAGTANRCSTLVHSVYCTQPHQLTVSLETQTRAVCPAKQAWGNAT